MGGGTTGEPGGVWKVIVMSLPVMLVNVIVSPGLAFAGFGLGLHPGLIVTGTSLGGIDFLSLALAV